MMMPFACSMIARAPIDSRAVHRAIGVPVRLRVGEHDRGLRGDKIAVSISLPLKAFSWSAYMFIAPSGFPAIDNGSDNVDKIRGRARLAELRPRIRLACRADAADFPGGEGLDTRTVSRVILAWSISGDSGSVNTAVAGCLSTIIGQTDELGIGNRLGGQRCDAVQCVRHRRVTNEKRR